MLRFDSTSRKNKDLWLFKVSCHWQVRCQISFQQASMTSDVQSSFWHIDLVGQKLNDTQTGCRMSQPIHPSPFLAGYMHLCAAHCPTFTEAHIPTFDCITKNHPARATCCSMACRLSQFHACAQEPGEWYEYRLRGLSDTLSFRAAPRAGPDTQISFVVYGDMGESDHARAKAPGYVAKIASHRVMHTDL